MNFWQKSTKAVKYNTTQISDYLAKPHILFFALPWLMILLVLGTVAQKNMGIYEATEKYFNSLILWLGPIPTPGGLATLGIIFLALSIKFIFYSPWKWKKSGTILTHLGVLILLIGGILTATMMKEGFIIIPEGKQSHKFSNYRERVLNLYNNDELIQSTSFYKLAVGDKIEHDDIEINILDICDNCSAQAPSGRYDNLQGLAVNMELFGIADEINKEANFSGAVLAINQSNTDLNGTYIVMEDVPRNPEFTKGNDKFEIKVERAYAPLPFDIYLKDFRKIDYPGTTKPREFESDIIIKDVDVEWPVTISMNKPLRYKGYTFYQSSFDQRDGMEVTVLNIVENKGWIFPYIATLIIFLGLLLHFIIRVQNTKQRGVA